MKTVAAALILALLAEDAHAAVLSWSADLAPENLVPALETAPPGAAGSATGAFDTASNLLNWSVVWSGLSGEAVSATIQGPAFPDQNGGLILNFSQISGLTSPSSGSAVVAEDVEQFLISGLLYIIVRTQQHPAGELRGQLATSPAPIPIPATFPLLLGAAACLGFIRRRRS